MSTWLKERTPLLELSAHIFESGGNAADERKQNRTRQKELVRIQGTSTSLTDCTVRLNWTS